MRFFSYVVIYILQSYLPAYTNLASVGPDELEMITKTHYTSTDLYLKKYKKTKQDFLKAATIISTLGSILI